MKRFLLTWFALCLVLNPVAGAFASSMTMPMGSDTESHCPGHESKSEQAQDMRMDCCPSDHDSKQCCDHCVSHASGLLNTGFSLLQSSIADLTITFIRPVLSATHSPPYKPPQA
jgi:hypothetical protein